MHTHAHTRTQLNRRPTEKTTSQSNDKSWTIKYKVKSVSKYRKENILKLNVEKESEHEEMNTIQIHVMNKPVTTFFKES